MILKYKLAPNDYFMSYIHPDNKQSTMRVLLGRYKISDLKINPNYNHHVMMDIFLESDV